MGFAEHVPDFEPGQFDCSRVERVFNQCFAGTYKARLCGGADEPLYQPAQAPGAYHALYYRGDYFASALHETAHWCIAGAGRRQQPDFGYWYTPEGRNLDQQRAFEAAEYKPQALEWFFSRACAFRFQVSADNLALDRLGKLDTSTFQKRVLEQARAWQVTGLPARPGIFYQALCHEFGTAVSPGQLRFERVDLG
jgi:elongation factor P hydroxylase